MVTQTKQLQRAKTAVRESKTLDFKRELDVSSAGAWCELIKDMIAFANSGGGIILLGVEDDGSNSATDPSSFLSHDMADITNRIFKYTNVQFSDFDVVAIKRGGLARVAVVVFGVDVPIVFTRPGTYDIGGGKQKTAFSQGTVYFRHGSKSEPCNREDLLSWREREIARARKSWLGGIRQVVQSPPGEKVTVLSTASSLPKDAAPVHAKISASPGALPVMPANPEEIWRHRGIDLIAKINQELGKSARINPYDIQCINKRFDVFKAHPEFAFKPHKQSAPQYSDEYAAWITDQFEKDKNFFTDCRNHYLALQKSPK
jgi:hypothetical protein